MAEFKLLVTEVTSFGSLFCVAGWDLIGKKLIRPKSTLRVDPSSTKTGFWSSVFCGKDKIFQSGNIISFSGEKSLQDSFPHAHENHWITSSKIYCHGQWSGQQIVTEIGQNGGIANSLAHAFNGHLTKEPKAYVMEGTHCGSLAGIIIPANNFKFDDSSRKLRGKFSENGQFYCPTITATDIKSAWNNEKNTTTLERRKQNYKCLHLRLGLAQACNGGKCYLQINSIYFIE